MHGRCLLALLAICLAASFALQQLPLLLAGLTWTLGSDGDTWSHVALQIDAARPEVFARDPELTLTRASRPRFEFVIHRTVAWVAEHVFAGNFIAANRAGFWLVHAVYLAGCIWLGAVLTSSWLAALLLGLACCGVSPAIFAWWGMPLGGVVPHDIGLATVPWGLALYFTRTLNGRSPVPAFAALGLATNLYPLHPAYTAGLLWLAMAYEQPRNRRRLLVCAAAFLVPAMPAIVITAAATARRFDVGAGPQADAVRELLRTRYGYLFPQDLSHALDRLRSSNMWFFTAILLLAAARPRRAVHPAAAATLRGLAIAGTVATFVGLIAGAWAPRLLLFLFHRVSVIVLLLSYVGTAALAAAWLTRQRWHTKAVAVALACSMLYFAWLRTGAGIALRTGFPVQTSEAYYEAAQWARRSTPPGSLFLIPFEGAPFYAFRVLAERPVLLHHGLGEIVLAGPDGALQYLRLEAAVRRLYAAPNVEAFRREAASLGVDYVIIEADKMLHIPLTLVFRNERFSIYAVERARDVRTR